ncbi:MAG: ImmA/IrrE family metallo-endopeptidase [Acidobacteriia bacterium]|nr:ImmA/IrrE family metallo-endopeptidase [Terriglobia bacterium]
MNPTHHPRRKRMTLMEEITHVHLRHVPSRLIRQADGLRMRDYDKPQEEEAFGVGAASLIPWGSFFPAINRGMAIPDLAEKFEVSEDLIRYRIQITAASKLYRARQRASE